MKEETKLEQPMIMGNVINQPVVNNEGKGGDFRDAMQGVWYCAVCLCCINSCFVCVDNFSMFC